jgi:hypothetical protein
LLLGLPVCGLTVCELIISDAAKETLTKKVSTTAMLVTSKQSFRMVAPRIAQTRQDKKQRPQTSFLKIGSRAIPSTTLSCIQHNDRLKITPGQDSVISCYL